MVSRNASTRSSLNLRERIAAGGDGGAERRHPHRSHCTRAAYLRTKKSDRFCVLRHARPVPIAGAVDRHFADATVADARTDDLACVPIFTVGIGPAFFELEYEAILQCVRAPAADAAEIWVALAPYGHQVVDGACLQSPLRQ